MFYCFFSSDRASCLHLICMLLCDIMSMHFGKCKGPSSQLDFMGVSDWFGHIAPGRLGQRDEMPTAGCPEQKGCLCIWVEVGTPCWVRWNKRGVGGANQETVTEEAQENDAVLNWMESHLQALKRRLKKFPPPIFPPFYPFLYTILMTF